MIINIKRFLLASIVLFVCQATASDLSNIVESCNACHGEAGVSIDPKVPTIAGLPAISLEYGLYAYLDKTRPAETMNGTDMIKETEQLTEDQITQLATYYSELPFVSAKQDFNAELAAKGEKIHQLKCDKCHSGGGSNTDDEASILAGQWMPYMKSEIEYMMSGERQTDDKMVDSLNALKPEYIEMLLHYYASQQ